MKRKLNIRITVLMITALLLLVLPMTAYAENEYEITQMSAQGEIISDVNVRSGPGTDYDKIGAVREKEIVVITGVSADGWYQIEYDGAEGFIYGKYVTVAEAKEEEPGTEDDGEETASEETASEEAEPDEEEVKASHSISKMLKPIAVVVIIAVIVIMIFLTIRSLRQSDESEDDDEDDYDEEEYEDDEYSDDEYEQEDEDNDEDEEEIVKTVKTDPQTIIIREEDYQLHIDPKYFEDEPITQPEFVTGYLKEKQEQEKEEENRKAHSGDLQKAMDKLQELQEEIEKLKKNQ